MMSLIEVSILAVLKYRPGQTFGDITDQLVHDMGIPAESVKQALRRLVRQRLVVATPSPLRSNHRVYALNENQNDTIAAAMSDWGGLIKRFNNLATTIGPGPTAAMLKALDDRWHIPETSRLATLIVLLGNDGLTRTEIYRRAHITSGVLTRLKREGLVKPVPGGRSGWALTGTGRYFAKQAVMVVRQPLAIYRQAQV